MNTILLGLICFLLGFSFLIDPFRKLDIKAFDVIYHKLSIFPGIPFFQETWFLGKTPFAIIVILFLTASNFWLGICALSTFTISAGLERFLKIKLNRPRPFTALPDVKMAQPKRPADPSFPSGDCVNIWFLVIILQGTFDLSWPVQSLFYLIALAVTMGRVVMGVHYPSDVLSGAGLGILAGKVTILIWDYLLPFAKTM